ncbi:MAG: LUD domain-containing protein [Candidatus Woesearchaeota archaeon]
MDDLVKEIKARASLKEILLPIVYSYKQKRDSIAVDKDKLRDNVRQIKEKSIEDISSLRKQAISNLQKSGITVLELPDAKAVKKVLYDIIGKEKLIVKSKSNLASELGLSEMLAGSELVETDVGDFLVNLAEEKESHPVLPALLLTPERISELIEQKLHEKVKPNPDAIVRFVREYIRGKLLAAKVGITGANVITADGSVVILENEGNISLVSRIPDKHVIIAGIDKIVPTREDALQIVKCAAVYGTGQDYPSYVNIISGPSKTADIQNETVTGAQGAKEVFLLLVDNGRSAILKSDYKELLYCINCGACLNFCPVYHQITTRYGSKFPGAKGVIQSVFLEGLHESYEHGAYFCTGCQACKENCPAKIDLPNLIKTLRRDLAKNGIEPKGVTEMIKNVKKFGNPFGEVAEGKIPKSLYCC